LVKKLRWIFALPVVVGFALLTPLSTPSFGGRAVAVQVRVPATGLAIALADSGPLPPSGGAIEAGLLSANIPSGQTGGIVALAAGTLHAAVVGLNRTAADASLADVNLTISGNGITAAFLMARSTATCGTGSALAGSSQLASLVVNGEPIAANGAANQSVALPNGSAVLNEQIPSVAGGTGRLVVNALHVITRDPLSGQSLADVVLATADAQIQCPTGLVLSEPVAAADPVFTDGGGWIPVSADKGTFGLLGGFASDGTPTGHLAYVDHGVDLAIESTSITAFAASACASKMSGTGTGHMGGVSGTVQFNLGMQDGGEPGRNDIFEIHVTGAFTYDAGPSALAGGNLQIDGTFAGGKLLAHGNTC